MEPQQVHCSERQWGPWSYFAPFKIKIDDCFVSFKNEGSLNRQVRQRRMFHKVLLLQSNTGIHHGIKQIRQQLSSQCQQ